MSSDIPPLQWVFMMSVSRSILNEPLPDYDPGMIPERATLERIRRRIRVWQQLNIP